MSSRRLFVPVLLLVAAGCVGGRATGPESLVPDQALGRSDSGDFDRSAPVAGDIGLDRAHYDNVLEMLRGMAPGLVLTSTGEIRIRGMNQSMGASNQGPLVVVDGIPSSRSAGAELLALRPSQVASITVLKDVASTVIYGIRGANGVIIVRTKRK